MGSGKPRKLRVPSEAPCHQQDFGGVGRWGCTYLLCQCDCCAHLGGGADRLALVVDDDGAQNPLRHLTRTHPQ